MLVDCNFRTLSLSLFKMVCAHIWNAAFFYWSFLLCSSLPAVHLFLISRSCFRLCSCCTLPAPPTSFYHRFPTFFCFCLIDRSSLVELELKEIFFVSRFWLFALTLHTLHFHSLLSYKISFARVPIVFSYQFKER